MGFVREGSYSNQDQKGLAFYSVKLNMEKLWRRGKPILDFCKITRFATEGISQPHNQDKLAFQCLRARTEKFGHLDKPIPDYSRIMNLVKAGNFPSRIKTR